MRDGGGGGGGGGGGHGIVARRQGVEAKRARIFVAERARALVLAGGAAGNPFSASRWR